jgi:iron complex transport system substrate-binding protein
VERPPRDAAGPPPFDEAAAAWLAAFGADVGAVGVVPFAPATYKEVLDGALALGHAAGRLPEAMRVLADGEARLRRLRDRLGLARWDRGVVALTAVAVVEAAEPLRIAGRWVPDLVRHAGGRAVLAEAGAPSRDVPWAALVEADPDVLVVAPREGAEAEAREAVRVLAARPEWPCLRAVRAGRVFALDGARLLYRPGPTLVEAAGRLAALLHPERCVEPEASHRR